MRSFRFDADLFEFDIHRSVVNMNRERAKTHLCVLGLSSRGWRPTAKHCVNVSTP